MPRSDGYLLKDIPAFNKVIPYIMNRRYDATNYTRIELDITNLRKHLRIWRDAGHRVGLMDAIICALAMVMQSTPEINRFVANKKIYQRNHRCVSFALIKREDGEIVETAVKVQINDGDDLIKISKNIRDLIDKNKVPTEKNKVDKFVDCLVSLPLLSSFSVSVFKFMDKLGILPKSIITLSPFHTSMFISNLASIKMEYMYHHLYDFGTTSFFVTLGKPKRKDGDERGNNKLVLGVSIDERICYGVVWAKAMQEFSRLIEDPEKMVF
ncbi:MAG: 2-oxo acid dehydrogenase subunit E2 [Lachnospiraceae bacterium]|nr:2-oxo acid dehydrogenase subunit E2 [Lachnospiraceae bacterium]